MLKRFKPSPSSRLELESDYNSLVIEPALRIIPIRLLCDRPTDVADYIYEFHTKIKSEIEAEASASRSMRRCGPTRSRGAAAFPCVS